MMLEKMVVPVGWEVVVLEDWAGHMGRWQGHMM